VAARGILLENITDKLGIMKEYSANVSEN